jgi:hypothetical protein
MRDRGLSITHRRLLDSTDAGLSGPTSAPERIALVEILTREAWALSALASPSYARCEIPTSIHPLRTIDPDHER